MGVFEWLEISCTGNLGKLNLVEVVESAGSTSGNNYPLHFYVGDLDNE